MRHLNRITYPYQGQTVRKCPKCGRNIYTHHNPLAGGKMVVTASNRQPHFGICEVPKKKG